MQEYKTIRNNLIAPLKDKTRLMKMEHLLSNNYVLAGIIGVIDLLVFFGVNYALNTLASIPALLLRRISVGAALSPRNIFPSAVSVPGVVVFLLAIAVLDIALAYKIKVSWSEDHFNVGQKGTSRFLTEEELKEEYAMIDLLDTPYPGDPGILVARIGDRLCIDQNVVNNLILGITRSGKGEDIIKPSIEIYSRAEHQPSLLISDPKLEHYKVFKKLLEKRGYEIHLLNISNPKYSMGFNLISVALDFYKKKDHDMAEMVVTSTSHSFFEVDKARGDMLYFTSAAAALFSAMVLASMQDAVQADEWENQTRYEEWGRCPEEERRRHPFRCRHDNENTVNLYSMIITFGNLVTRPINKDGSRTLLDKYFEERPPYDRARLKYLGVEIAPGKTKSGVFAEMLRHLDKFTLHNVGQMTAESTLDFAELGFGKKPIAVFLAVPSYDASLYKIPTIFIRQMYYVLGKMCDDGKGRCDRQVKVIFDEGGNMPEIELMNVMTTMGLGQNISFDIVLHNYEQLADTYGKEIAQTIKGNCGNHFYIQTKSEDTAIEFSKMLGNKSIIDVQRAGGKLSFNKYFTESVQERPLLNMNELMELQEGECVVSRSSKRQDLQKKKIKPRPIFNSVENGHYFLHAYEYFPKETYRHPNEVEFFDVCSESRAHIRPRERIWDVKKSWKLLEENRQRIKTLGDVGYDVLEPLFRISLGEHFEKRHGISEEMTVAEAASLVQQSDFPEAEKETIMGILSR